MDPSSLLRPECTQSSEPVLGAALGAQGWAGSLAPAWPMEGGFPVPSPVVCGPSVCPPVLFTKTSDAKDESLG